jgi:hypothetical protein
MNHITPDLIVTLIGILFVVAFLAVEVKMRERS